MKNENIPLVSIIVPIYNVEKYIERCAKSIFSQTYSNIEIIFCDDKTPDKSLEVLEQLISNYNLNNKRLPIIKILKANSNAGQATARNKGLNEANGEYVFFLDSDDYIPPNAIESLITSALETNSDIVKGDFRYSFEDKVIRDFKIDIPKDKQEYLKLLVNWCSTTISVCGGLYRRRLFIENNVYFLHGHNMGEDFCLSCKICYYANRIQKIQSVTYCYEFNPNSITHNFSLKNANDLIANSNEVFSFYKNKYDFSVYEKDLHIGRAKIKNYILRQLPKEQKKKYKQIFPELNNSPFISKYGKIKCYLAKHSNILYRIFNRLISKY